ncbi:MAG: pyridoxal 5'-phosphate synthase glutaminase subunit PdxT [SAR324 cluster bacterium]|nr:pyridoxal 5'-phosphate synthase glutaminase subunit PdxT [SAR324 cluster bacterium]
MVRPVAILALQGAVEPHRVKLSELGEEGVPVRTAEELAACRGLILPGGESTTLLNLIEHYRLAEPLAEFAAAHPVWGVCAGAILMAERVENPEQVSFGWMPLTVRRNAYGRQNESFIDRVALKLPGQPPAQMEGVFIRAPRIVEANGGLTVLAEHGGSPVTVQYGHHLATTFHPELSSSQALHRHFLSLCDGAAERSGRRLA